MLITRLIYCILLTGLGVGTFYLLDFIWKSKTGELKNKNDEIEASIR